MKVKNRHLLILILLVATILRFYNYFEISFTHDEFSALFRTKFHSFSDLIEYGVKTSDTHPAGIQVFIFYWIKLFGDSAWSVKLPFVLSGILSVYGIYLIGKEWYNETVALVSATFLASIQYTIMYSQLARPYTSGLCFVLFMVYFWTLIVKKPEVHFFKNASLYVLFSALCAYNHHFSFLFAAIVGISGLFFIQKEFLVKYILCGIVIVLLYLPHVSIFLYQLSMGGIEEWLSKPQNDFIIDYLAYTFHYSVLVYLVVLGLVGYGIYTASKQGGTNKKQLILFACWFILPFLIGFLYSKYVNSVIQFSVLIFSFPFLLFVLFGFIKPQKTNTNLILITLIFVVNIYTLIHGRQHYTITYKSPYRELLIDHQYAQKEFENNVFSVLDSDKKITPYFNQQLGIDSNYIWFNTFTSIKEFSKYIKQQKERYSYFYFGSLSSNNPLCVPIIQQHFPTIVWQHNYAGATSYLFSTALDTKSDVFDELDFETESSPNWSTVDNNWVIDSLHYAGKKSYLITPDQEYSFSFTKSLEYLITHENNFIDISVQAHLSESEKDIILVSTIDDNDKNIHWSGTSFSDFEKKDSASKWTKIVHTIKISDIPIDKEMTLKVYIWNKGKHTFAIDNFKVVVREGNPIIYGLLEDFN